MLTANRLKLKLERDPKFLRAQHNYATYDYFNLPIKKLLLECDSLHISRTIRTLKVTDSDFHSRIIEACLHDQAIRSRLSEILVQSIKGEKKIIQVTDSLKNYYITEYAEQLNLFRTKDERLRFIDTLFEQFYEYSESVKLVSSIASTIIKDIDQAAYALKLTVDVLKLWNAPERTV